MQMLILFLIEKDFNLFVRVFSHFCLFAFHCRHVLKTRFKHGHNVLGF